jgi:CspA family cold shock protein
MAETGTVKWFDGKKGYGFLTRPDGAKDVFFHATDLRKSGIEDEDVDEGHRFTFELATTPRGLKAVKLNRVEADGNAAPVVAEPEQVVAEATIPVPEDDGNIR